MKRVFSARPSPAIIVAVVALVAALAGTAIAGPGAGTSALTKAKVKKIAGKEVAKAFPVGTGGIADLAVTTGKLADDAVSNGKIAAGAVTKGKLAAKSVGTAEWGTITERTEAYAVEDDAAPYERQEVDCLPGEQAVSGDVAPFILVDDNESGVNESNYDPNGAGAGTGTTGWIFGLANYDDVTGIGDGDNADVTGTLAVLCLEP